MPGLFGMLEIARRSLSAQSLSMEVTSHNIANATTPGYSRQRANLVEGMSIQNAQGLFLGTGVNVESIGRLRDKFLDGQFRQAYGSYGSATTQQSVLSAIEVTLNEPSDSGLQATMNNFFNSFQELSAHPEDPGPRNAVLQKGTNLVQTFNRLSSGFTAQRTNIADDATNKISQINSLTQQVASLNQQIITASGGGNEPGDLMDQRDAAIDQLSQLTNITASRDSTGAMLVSIGGMLVAGNGTSVTLQSSVIAGNLTVTTNGGQEVPVTGGQLGAGLELYNKTIPGYMSKLDSLASTIISRVNAVQSSGYGLGNPPPTGINFFTGTSAGTIAINTQISSNTNNIAASSDGQPGNNANALALFGISNEQLMDGNSRTLTQFYGGLVSTIGSAVESANGATSGGELILNQLDAQRNSVSGVSLDEEMTNMIKFQHSYEAASRLVSTTNELFTTILAMVPL